MTIFTHKFRLKDVTEIQVGFPFKSAEYSDTGIKLLRGDNIGQGFLQWNGVKFWPIEKSSHLSQYILQKDDVVIAMDRPWISSGLKYSVIHHENDRTLLVQRVARLRSLPDIHKYILPYIIGSRNFTNYVLSVQTGTTIPHISLDQIGDYEFFAPPIKEQEKIGSLLRRLDDKIDLNRRTNETLEAMARALFRDWFVDFGPTRAKMAGEAPYLAPELWELFPDRLDDEGKPEGWRIASIDSLCRITSGKRPPNKETSPSDENPVPVYGGNGISWFTKDVLFNQPFLITGRVGTLGTVFRINEKCWVSDNALCLFPKIDSYFEYLYFIVSGIDFQSLNSGSTQPLLTQSSLLSQECILPAEEIITIFHTQISVWFEMQQQLEKESHTLVQLRDLLLPKLMSGEISIRDAEKMVEDAA
ncbi:restriction endonuclease subunit S [Acetobacter pasteurianus]|uniref:Type I DNA specificity S subunit n=1 Tax=Acetobacter pasteurianus NBRC 3188 TaxID=1226663 RepID=A0A401WYW0_ACEPA|nr:restriction endonuclease subunit S [Acetobacter pasteurianus]GCD54484.1 type I DNA specificity S subunit [Acetobacter pasteurianus NBRC 3188]